MSFITLLGARQQSMPAKISDRCAASGPAAAGSDQTLCGGPRYGNSVSMSVWGPTPSPFTFPFVKRLKRWSTTSSVSPRPLAG